MDSTDTAADERPRRRQSRKLLIIVAAALGLAVVAGGSYGLWYILVGPASPPAVASLAPVIPSGTGVPAPASLDGTWQVNDSLGSFGDFSSSWAGYRVQEQLGGIGGHTAVGRTPGVTGSMTLAGATVDNVVVTADMTGLVSDDSRRDSQLRDQAIETGSFPTATFKSTQAIVLSLLPADGKVIGVTANGTLTLHGVTRSVQIALQAQRQGGIIAVSGSIDVVFADYGFQGPTSLAVISVADHGIMELHLLFTHA